MRRAVPNRRGVLAVVAALALAACVYNPTESHISSAVTSHFKGLPTGVTVPAGSSKPGHDKPWATWAGPRSVYVMTWGSGSCPLIPSSVYAVDANHVVIKTVVHDFYKHDNGCSGDLAVTTSIVRLPSNVDTSHALVVRIDGARTRLARRVS